MDKSVPGLLVKIGAYPVHHGGVGVIRSLGRLGVPMYAVTEDRFTPAALSRYLTRAFVWPTTGLEQADYLVEELEMIGRKIGRPALLLPTDDEAAVLIAEHANVLGKRFLISRVDPHLPRQLASKQGLYELCINHGVPTPMTAFPGSYAEIEEYAATARFPVVIKNREAFERLRAPAVPETKRITEPQELLALARKWGDPSGVILQEYLPQEEAEDWIVHAYADGDHAPRVLFTGVKVRSWPPHAGVTSCAYSVSNPELAVLAARFIERIGFSGILDMDWRYDRRDAQYNLLDFNPRIGANFRLFESTAALDVVRAQHLDLTGHEVPGGQQINGRRFVVENADLASRMTYWRSGHIAPHVPRRVIGTELAWFAHDDIKPFLAMCALSAQIGARLSVQVWRGRNTLRWSRRRRLSQRPRARSQGTGQLASDQSNKAF